MGSLNVAVIFGGHSPEHDVSISSAANIINCIDNEKYNVIPVYITKSGRWLMYEGRVQNIKNIQWEKFGTPCQICTDTGSGALLRISGQKVKSVPVDVAFPVLHGKNGEDGTIQGLFEMAGLPYVGCGVMSSAAAMDKALTKIIVNSLGIAQAKHLEFKNVNENNMESILKNIRYKIGYPCFIKPARGGSSVGINKALDRDSLKAALEDALTVDNKIIAEKAVIGRELECAVLTSENGDILVSDVGEILSGEEFYTFDAKYNNTESKTVIPADIPEEAKEEIKNSAAMIFDTLDCSGLSRVDFFLEEGTDKVIFNEINTMPGFTDISMYPLLIENMGISYKELIDMLINTALRVH